MTAEKEIRERLLEQAIPSDYMREFYRSIDRNFTDFELTAMLWNSRKKQTETLRAIRELPEEIREYVGMVSDMVQGNFSLDFFLLEYEKRRKGEKEE